MDGMDALGITITYSSGRALPSKDTLQEGNDLSILMG
jgi:hypothetical protein